MKKVKVTKVKNPVSTKGMPAVHTMPTGTGRGFFGPGVNVPVATKSYKKGR